MSNTNNNGNSVPEKASKTKTTYCTNDNRTALLKWLGKESYNCCPMNDVEMKDSYVLHTTNDKSVEYSVRWARTLNGPKQKFKAYIILIDTEEKCNQKLEQITNYLVDETLKAKITKTMPPKEKEKTNNANREECEKELAQSQIETLTNKLKDKEITIDNLRKRIADLENINDDLKKKAATKESDIDLTSKAKLLTIASCIFNNFGTLSDVQDLIILDDNESEMVSLSLTLPEYKIKSTLRKSLVKMIKKGVDTSKIYRVFLSGVYQPEFLGNHNAETFSGQELIALNAFRDFIAVREDFLSLERKIIREVANESRQKIWLNHPDTIFKVENKEIKFIEKTTEKKAKKVKTSNKENSIPSSPIVLNAANSNAFQIQQQLHPTHYGGQHWSSANFNHNAGYSNLAPQYQNAQKTNSNFYPINNCHPTSSSFLSHTSNNFHQMNNTTIPQNQQLNVQPIASSLLSSTSDHTNQESYRVSMNIDDEDLTQSYD